jgi:hypothetical protein
MIWKIWVDKTQQCKVTQVKWQLSLATLMFNYIYYGSKI